MGLLDRLKRGSHALVPYCGAVVPAAGRAVRMGGEEKLLLPLGGRPVLVHTLQALEKSDLIREIVVVTRQELVVPVGQLCREYGLGKVTKVIKGGETRSASVYAGLCELSKEVKLAAIHDGARPLVTTPVIEQAILRCVKTGAAAPAVAIKDTVKRGKDGIVEETLARESLFAVQTPQVFLLDVIRSALQKALEEGIPLTDDCGAVERLGIPVSLTPGSEENIKITTPADLLMAEALLERRGRD